MVLSKPVILVVDDNSTSLKATIRVLEQADFNTLAASSGQEALRLIRESRPQLVLLDVVLPDISGLEVLKQVRTDPSLDTVSIVLLSSQQITPENQAEGLNTGAEGYIARPIANSEFLARVRVHIRQRELLDQLSASERRFRNLITEQADGILVVNRDGVIQFANPTAGILFGRKPAALVGSPFGFPLETQTAQEIDLQRPGQDSIAVEMRSVPTFWEGAPAWLISLNDITERRRIEQERKKLLHDLGERVKELKALHQTAELLQEEDLTIQELLARVVEIIPPSMQYPAITAARVSFGDVDVISPRFQSTPWKLESQFKTFQGVEGLVEAVYLESCPDESDEPFLKEEIHLIRTLADMLKSYFERREATHAMRISEETFRTFLHNSPTPTFIKDDSGRFLYVNPVWKQQFDPKPEDWFEKTDYDFWPKETADEFRKSDLACLTQNTVVNFEETGLDREGRRHHWMVMKYPIRTDRGMKVGGVAWNVTERKRIERMLHFETRVMAAISTRQSLQSILTLIATGLEEVMVNIKASLLLVENHENATKLLLGAAPSFPDAFIRSVNGMMIEQSLSPNTRTVEFDSSKPVPDIDNDPAWERYRDLASIHGFQSSWSTPVMNDKDQMVAVLSLYYHGPRHHQQKDNECESHAVHLVGLAVDRDQREKALVLSETRYRSIFQLIPTAILEEDWSKVMTIFQTLKNEGVTDLDDYIRTHPDFVDTALSKVKIVDVNQATIKLFEADSKEALLDNSKKIFSTPEARACFVCELKAMAQGNRGFETTIPLKTLKGKPLQVYLTMALPVDEEDKGMVLMSITDITEVKRAQQKASAYAALGRRLGSVTDEHEAARIIVNTAYELFGWDAAWLHRYDASSGHTYSVLDMDLVDGARKEVPPANHDCLPSPAFSRIIKQGGQLILRSESELKPTDLAPYGDKGRLSASLLFVSLRYDNEPLAVLSIQSYTPNFYTQEDLSGLQDLADYCGGALSRIRALNDLRQSETRFATIFRSSPAAIAINTIHEGRFIEVNDSYCNLVGYTREELLNNRVQNLNLWENPQDREPVIERLLKEGHVQGFETRFRRKNGELRDVIISLEEVRLPGESDPTLIAQFTDVTDRKKMEKQILRTQRLESIGTLAGGIAHDLNNVFAPIMMSIDLLQMDAKEPGVLKILDTLNVSARRGADMVKQILSFSRGFEGKRVLVNLSHVVRDVQKIIKETFPKDIGFEIQLPKDLWPVLADPTQMHQIIINLCVNSRDAMPNGGKITLSLENNVLDELYSQMNPELNPGAYIILKITDTGEGIPPEVQENVFDPFFTTKEVGKGTGLGLSTVMGIVKNHGGNVNLYSEPGHGTTFKIYLPASAEEAQVEETAVQQTQLPRGQGQLILVIDDEENIRNLVERTLIRFGYRVELASNGAEAVSKFVRLKNEVALVLTDMAMPIMDGPSTIIALKSIDPSVKIIGSSGLTFNGLVSKAMGAGVSDFIPKPYTTETMLKVIHDLIVK